VPETKAPETINAEVPQRDDIPRGSSDASFRLGDLFKDKEPDIFSQWDREDEEERRIHARREKRRAEAARRSGEDDNSKMKTAAALFVVREGIRNIFGKVSAPIIHNEARDEQEKEAEKALNELAAAKNETYTPARELPTRRPPMKAEGDTAAPENAEEQPTPREKRRSAAKAKQKRITEQEKKTAQGSERKDPAAPERKAFSEAKGRSVAKIEAPPAKPLRLQKSIDVADADSGYESASFFDYFKNPSRPSRTAIVWMAGGAAGAVAVILIALVIVNSHAVDMIASGF
jgi:hypothetical protein